MNLKPASASPRSGLADISFGTWRRRLKSGHLPGLGLLFAVVILFIAVGCLLHERNSIEKMSLTRVDLLARTIEHQTAATIDAARAGLDMLAAELADEFTDALADEPLAQQHDRLTEVLRNGSMPLVFVRSFSIVDAASTVLVSSRPENQGKQMLSGLLQFPSDSRAVELGGLIGGRDLADATRPSLNPKRQNFLPLIRKLGTATKFERFLVAVIDLEYLLKQHSVVLADPTALAVLMSFRGQLVVSTDALALTPGMSRSKYFIFSEFLPLREQGSFIGSGLRGDRVVAAFRALSPLPLLAVVEQPYSVVDDAVSSFASRLGVLLIIGYLLLGALIVMARRNLKRHEERALSTDSNASAGIAIESSPGEVVRGVTIPVTGLPNTALPNSWLPNSWLPDPTLPRTEWLAPRTAFEHQSHRREFEPNLEAIRALRGFVTSQATEARLPEVAVGLLEIAATEAFTNVLRHGNPMMPDAPVELVTRVSNGNFELDLIHRGDPFTPSSDVVDADLSEFPEGGFGLWIIDAACDRVQYLQRDGLNIIRLSKSVGGAVNQMPIVNCP